MDIDLKIEHTLKIVCVEKTTKKIKINKINYKF